MGYSLDDYEPVKDRIARFYGDHPDGAIHTELVSDPATLADAAAFCASVIVGGVVVATGYAYEERGQGVNKDAWVENSETSAIGRALANFNYCRGQRPSREEMLKVQQTAPAHGLTTRQELLAALGDAVAGLAEEEKERYRGLARGASDDGLRELLEEARAVPVVFGQGQG